MNINDARYDAWATQDPPEASNPTNVIKYGTKNVVTVGQLREALAHLDDEDQVTIASEGWYYYPASPIAPPHPNDEEGNLTAIIELGDPFDSRYPPGEEVSDESLNR